MTDTTAIREHMEVVGNDGGHVGTVDHVNGDEIKLTRTDYAAGGQHHLVPTSLVASVDEQVHLSQPAEQVRGSWHAA